MERSYKQRILPEVGRMRSAEAVENPSQSLKITTRDDEQSLMIHKKKPDCILLLHSWYRMLVCLEGLLRCVGDWKVGNSMFLLYRQHQTALGNPTPHILHYFGNLGNRGTAYGIYHG